MVHDAVAIAAEPHRGPVFLDFPLDVFGPSAGDVPTPDPARSRGADPDPDAVAQLAAAHRRRASGRPSSSAATSTGPGRGPSWPPPSSTCASRCSPTASAAARCPPTTSWRSCARGAPSSSRPTSSSCSARRSTSASGSGASASADVAHVVDAESQRAAHVDVLTVVGDIAATLRGLAEHTGDRVDHEAWIADLRDAEEAARAGEAALLAAADGPIKPTRVYGELRRRLARDAVVICDGGDFASYAGKYVEVFEPGCWLDTGPYGCLGNGLGYSIAARVARPDAQVVAVARRRRRRVQPDGRRLARPPRPARRDDRRQQRHVGLGEAPDAGHLRLGRGVRPPAGAAATTRSCGRSAEPASW